MALVSKAFGDIITFTRASTATYFDSAGVLQSAAIDTPRFDYDPATLAARGFLIEEARTNSIRNNTMVGAVAGTPGTLPTNWVSSTTGAATSEVVGTGTENGITYIDIRFQGAGAADTWNLIYDSSVVAANGQTWTGSVYLKLAGGSTANIPFIQRIVFRDSGFANIQAVDTSAITPTSAGLTTQRSALSLTATQATTAFITYQLNSGTPTGAYDITIRIGLPQLEQGAFATSVIPTTTTALTRSADVASVNTLSPWFNASEGTLYAEFTRGYTGNFSNFATPAIVTNNLTGASANNIASATQNGANQQLFNSMLVSGVEQLTYAFENASVNNKVALAYATNNTQQFINGVAKTTDTVCSVPTSLTRLNIGANFSGTTYVNSWIRRVTYYPRRISQTEGVAITA